MFIFTFYTIYNIVSVRIHSIAKNGCLVYENGVVVGFVCALVQGCVNLWRKIRQYGRENSPGIIIMVKIGKRVVKTVKTFLVLKVFC